MLEELLLWLKQTEYNLSVTQRSDGTCIVCSEDTGAKIEGMDMTEVLTTVCNLLSKEEFNADW